jgi:hypothetical protein
MARTERERKMEGGGEKRARRGKRELGRGGERGGERQREREEKGREKRKEKRNALNYACSVEAKNCE